MRYGQGGERYKVKETHLQEDFTVRGYDDDKYWYLGLIYFNREDPSVWVEKRVGIGFTVNFGNSRAWLFMLLILILPILPLILLL